MPSNISECHLYEEMEPFTYFYYLVFLTGIIGGCFTLWAFTRKEQEQKCLSIYLINLLTADFLLTLALPVKIIVDLGIASWNLRIFHCQVTACLIYLNMYLSIVFLGLVSADRCLQLMHSSRLSRIQEPGVAKVLSAVLWVVLLLITLPNAAIRTRHIEERPGVRCIDFKTKLGRDWHVFTDFICTAAFLHFSAVLLVPSLRRALFKAKEATLLLALSNLCLDPLLCCLLSESFRLELAEAPAAPEEGRALAEAQEQSRSPARPEQRGENPPVRGENPPVRGASPPAVPAAAAWAEPAAAEGWESAGTDHSPAQVPCTGGIDPGEAGHQEDANRASPGGSGP